MSGDTEKIFGKVVDAELKAMGRFLITLKWARDFIDTEEGKKVIELIENGDALEAERLIFRNLQESDAKDGKL